MIELTHDSYQDGKKLMLRADAITAVSHRVQGGAAVYVGAVAYWVRESYETVVALWLKATGKNAADVYRPADVA